MFDITKAMREITTRKTREDVVDYFQEKYPGSKMNKNGKEIFEWHRKLAEEMQPFARGAKGQQMSIPNLMRRFQKRGGVDPFDKEPSRKQQAEYEALGATLPPMIPEGGFHITGTICIHYADDPCEERDIDIVIDGEDARKMVENPDMQAIVNVYMEWGYDGPDAEAGGPPLTACAGGEDCEPDLSIEPIE